MLIFKPEYFDRFRCAAASCPDSCCKEWDVQVDEEKAALYRSLPGDLGDRLREVLFDEDGQTFMAIQDGRCPMWRPDGLCRIQAELGEGALCRVCREFPRLTHDFGDFRELGLELSCPEAAKFILADENTPLIAEKVPGGEEGDYDREAMDVLLSTRETMLALLSDDRRPVGETLALALLFGCQAQGALDSGEMDSFDPDASLLTARELAAPGGDGALLDLFRELEILTPEWKAMLESPAGGDWERGHLALARYFVRRYWLQAVSDYDLYSRVKLMVIACLTVRTLGGDLLKTAQLFSKEIENSADNVDALLDGAYTAPALRDDRLLGMLL